MLNKDMLEVPKTLDDEHPGTLRSMSNLHILNQIPSDGADLIPPQEESKRRSEVFRKLFRRKR